MNAIELESRINNNPFILNGIPLVPGCVAYEQFACDLWARIVLMPNIQGVPAKDFPEEADAAMRNCIPSYNPNRGPFWCYFQKDFSFRARTSLKKEWKQKQCLGYDGYSSDDGEVESREDALDRSALRNEDSWDFFPTPADEVCRLITCGEILDGLLRGFNSLQERSKEKVAACLTASFYEGLTEDEVLEFGIYRLPVFHKDTYLLCKKLKRPISRREIAANFHIQESNLSRLFKNFLDKCDFSEIPVA